LVIFVLIEQKEEHPFLPVSLFKDRGILMVNLYMLFFCSSFYGTPNFIPLFLQEGNHMSIYKSGLILLSTAVGWMFGSTPAGNWIIRFGYKNLFIIGNIVSTLSGLVLYFLIQDISYIGLFTILTVQGFSFGLLFAVGTIASQELAEPQIRGMSTSLQMFLRSIGTSIGVMVMGLIINHATTLATGMKNIYLFSLFISVITLVVSFLIPAKKTLQSNSN
jgi:MFS family permease